MIPQAHSRRFLTAPAGLAASLILLSLSIFFLAAQPGLASDPFLVRDIRPGAVGSAPSELVTIGDTTFFAADDGIHGIELWKSDGTAGGTVMVEDICEGACDSEPESLTAVGDILFFGADDGTLGTELWKSDGTAGGTSMVKDIQPGAPSTPLEELTAVGQVLFFRALGDGAGYELWKSNGTGPGTFLVADINPGPASSFPNFLTSFNGAVYFDAGGNGGRELWKSDGTASGTVRVKDVRGGSASSTPRYLTVVGDTLFFTAVTSGRELWKTDGSQAGTVLVKEIDPTTGESDPIELTAVGGELYFVADDGEHGAEIWKSDGTNAGTVLVADLVPGAGSPSARGLIGMDGVLYFAADDGQMGEELWRSDGSLGGTWVVRDINPGPPASDPSSPSEFAAVGSMLYFAANDGIVGNELCQSDGTWEGTQSVADLMPGPDSSNPANLTVSSDLMLFVADDGIDGLELWAMPAGGAALEIDSQFGAESVVVGTGGHTLTFEVTNSGTSEAENVRVTSAVDSRLTVTNVSPTGACSASSGQGVDCQWARVDGGGSETIIVTFDVGLSVPPALEVTVSAEVVGAGGQSAEAGDSINLLAPCSPLPVDLVLTEETIVDFGNSFEACNSISVGPAVEVTSGGDATFRAGGAIVFNNGFSVDREGSIAVISDPLQSTG